MKAKFITNRLLFPALLFLVNGAVATAATSSRADSIRTALHYQQKHYPASQYRDVYKNFMQDFFGPGHILNDTIAAGKYLRRELTGTDVFAGPDYEPTGFRGNFYRVNLGLIADGTIPYGVFFDAFVNSVRNITPPDPSEWMSIWTEIDDEIKSMDWSFDNEREDRSALERQFSEGNYIAHHSAAYNKAVNFHYRIISRENFEKTIRPYLTQRKQH